MSCWDQIYAEGRQMTRWPWSDLVALVKRHAPDLVGKRVLELGCGPGANIPFFDAEGCEYMGVEAANVAIPPARGRVFRSDFTKIVFDQLQFDLICDRAAVVHNDEQGIRQTLAMALHALRPGGLYIGVDWFSAAHEDKTQFDGIPVTLCSSAMLRELFAKFEILSMEHKVVDRHEPRRPQFASWNIVARKPG